MGTMTALVISLYLPFLILGLTSVSPKPQYSEKIPEVGVDLPSQSFYQPEKSPDIPVQLGERRCDNYYNGQILPCLLRPWLPPFSYSTTEGINGEYRRKRSPREWRTLDSRLPPFSYSTTDGINVEYSSRRRSHREWRTLG